MLLKELPFRKKKKLKRISSKVTSSVLGSSFGAPGISFTILISESSSMGGNSPLAQGIQELKQIDLVAIKGLCNTRSSFTRILREGEYKGSSGTLRGSSNFYEKKKLRGDEMNEFKSYF